MRQDQQAQAEKKKICVCFIFKIFKTNQRQDEAVLFCRRKVEQHLNKELRLEISIMFHNIAKKLTGNATENQAKPHLIYFLSNHSLAIDNYCCYLGHMFFTEITGAEATPPSVKLTDTEVMPPLLVLKDSKATPPLLRLTERPHLPYNEWQIQRPHLFL